jgi:hypothetical protein
MVGRNLSSSHPRERRNNCEHRSTCGTELAREDARSTCGSELAREDARSTCGSELAREDARSNCGSELAREDARSNCGSELAREDARSNCGSELAREDARSADASLQAGHRFVSTLKPTRAPAHERVSPSWVAPIQAVSTACRRSVPAAPCRTPRHRWPPGRPL